jgi:hypothetical protein
MSTFDPKPDADINPYAPPSASLEGPPAELTDEQSRVEAIRKKYLNHEASVQSVGSLHILVAVINGLGTLGVLTSLFSGPPQMILAELFFVVIYGGFTALNFALGIGLRRLKTWARWVEVALTVLGMASLLVLAIWIALTTAGEPTAVLIFLIWWIIPAYILYILLSAKGRMVFSPEYREVIEQTPHIKYRMGCLLRGFVYVLVIVIGLGIIGSLIRMISR